MKLALCVDLALCLVCVCVFPAILGQAIDGNDELLCASDDCSKPMIEAISLIAYSPDEDNKLPLKKGSTVTIYGKNKDKKLSVIKDPIGGKYGFVPTEVLRELKKLATGTIRVPISTVLKQNVVKQTPVPFGVNAEAGNHTPTPALDVINGSTIPIDPAGQPITPTATPGPSVTPTNTPSTEDEEDEDDEEEEEDEDEDEDLNADGSNNDSVTETPSVQPTSTETTSKLMADILSQIDDASNTEPGKDYEADQEILKSQVTTTTAPEIQKIPTPENATSNSTHYNQTEKMPEDAAIGQAPTEAVAKPPGPAINPGGFYPGLGRYTSNPSPPSPSTSQETEEIKKESPPADDLITQQPIAPTLIQPEETTETPQSTETKQVEAEAEKQTDESNVPVEAEKPVKEEPPQPEIQPTNPPPENVPQENIQQDATEFKQQTTSDPLIEDPFPPPPQFPNTEQKQTPTEQPNNSQPNNEEPPHKSVESDQPETPTIFENPVTTFPPSIEPLQSNEIVPETPPLNSETPEEPTHKSSDETIETDTLKTPKVSEQPETTLPPYPEPNQSNEITTETPPLNSEPPETSEEPTGFFSSILKMFASETAKEEEKEEPLEIIPAGECKSEIGLESNCDDAPTSPDILNLFDKTVPENSYVLLYLISTSVTVLLFLLGYYFLERTRQDGPLVAKVNQLTHELQVAKAQQVIKSVDDSRSIEMNAALLEAHEELAELRKIKTDLEAQLEGQQQELDATTEAGLEMNRMLTDLLAQRNASETLLKSVENLQGQLNAQQQIIDGMNKSLTEKKAENEALQAELAAAQAKADNLEEESNSLSALLKEKETGLFELENVNLKLEEQLAAAKDSKKTDTLKLNKSVEDLKQRLRVRDSEYQALKVIIDDLKKREGVDVDALYDVGNVRAELARARAEKEELQEKFAEEVGARKLLEDHVKAIDEEVLSLRLSFETAEKEKIEAETKLTVLSNYFKEKENQLHKELGLQEAMWAQKQGDENTILETIKSLKDEVESYNFDSFNVSNELLSVTNSASSLCTDAVNLISISPKLSEPLSSWNNDNDTPSVNLDPWNYPVKKNTEENLSIRSLPVKTKAKPFVLPRRKSSVDFEARLERAEAMTACCPPTTYTRSIPEDLLKLQEMQTVRASPFRVSGYETPDKPASDVLIDLNAVPVPLKRTSRCSDKSESEDSQSTSKESEIAASSARVEFDIKVVANALSNVKKVKKKTTRPKNGAQSETLKKEILDQERGLKGQIATLEKKAHENWVAARQAERRLEESKQEAGQLRNMLTLMEKSTDSEQKPSVRLPGELNGDDVLPPFLSDGSSPLPLPPLPLDPTLLPPGFMPPFFPPPFMPPPGEHRPPPLGRMSSPPLTRFSPGPVDFSYDRMSPRPPPVRSYRSPPNDPERFHHPWDDRSGFRPVASPREHRNDYPDSDPSSRPSSAGSLEKPSRRGKV